MKAHEHWNGKHHDRRFEQILDAAVCTIFSHCPTLCGFAVRESANSSGGLFITEISIYPQCDLEPPAEIRYEIVSVLTTLIDQCPEASDLMRERTFARVFH